MAGRIVLAGSCLTAMTMTCQRFPAIGETVIAADFMTEAGGKGTNQALAAARFGSEVALIGCVGSDAFGEGVLQTFREFGVNIEGVRIDPVIPTGAAFVIVNSAGNNMIAVTPGANAASSGDDFERNRHLVMGADIIGFQLELEMDYVEYGIRRAAAMGVRTLLDPAPAKPLPKSLYPCLDFIKPNEVEASLLTGVEVTDRDSAFEAAQWFLDKGVRNAIITLGEQGVVIVNEKLREHLTPPRVVAKDSTAAGDIFCGALMHGLTERQDLLDAARFAVYASAYSVQTMGGIQAMPTRQQVLEFMDVCNK